MDNKPSLPLSAQRSLPSGEWKRLAASWLLTTAVFLGPVALVLCLSGRYDLWSWTVSAPARGPELRPGDLAPDFTLRDLEGRSFHLAEEVLKSPVVVEFGSFS